MAFQFQIATPPFPGASLVNAVTAYTSGAQVILDAGDPRSMGTATKNNSGQTWLDMSGNSYDFNFGATIAVSTDDPTFIGSTSGTSSSNYFTNDTGDFFSYEAATNPAFMHAFHKDNAVFTILAWINGTSTNIFRTTRATGTVDQGIAFTIAGAGNQHPHLEVLHNNGTAALTVTATFSINAGWNMVAVVVDEAATTGVFYINSATESFTSTYTSPSATDSSAAAKIFDQSGVSTKLATVTIWSSALTATQIAAIFGATRSLFGV